MTPQQLSSFLILPLLINLILTTSLITYAIRRSSLGISHYFAGVCICLVIWNAGFIMEILSPGMDAKIFFSNFSLSAISLLPPAFFALAAMQAGFYTRLKRHLWLTLILPSANILVIWSDPFHHLFRAQVSYASYNGYLYLNPQFGPWFDWIHVPAIYILLGLSLALLLLGLPRQQPIYRKQTWAVIVSLVLPFGVSLATTYNLIPLPYYDLTPSMLTLSCLVIGYALFRYSLLKVVPLARDLVFEQMSDGVLVLDNRHMLVDFNPAAQKIMNLRIGDPADDILTKMDVAKMPVTASQVQFSLGQNLDKRQYNARISAVYNNERNLLGWAILLHDNTENLHMMERLQHMATVDELTEVFNRRYFMYLVNDEWARARRYDRMMALIMMDMDYFKQINDTYGHLAGDAALKDVLRLCKQNLRDIDRIGRFGGEEFTILLPETDLEGARATAERLCQKIAEHIVNFRGLEFHVTASFGVSELPPDRDATSITRFLKAADDALYVAKNSGRNQVGVSAPWQPGQPATPGDKK